MVEEWSDGKVNDSMNFRQDFAVGVSSRSRASLQAIAAAVNYMRFSARTYRNATVWSEVISKRLRHRWFLQLMVSSIRTR